MARRASVMGGETVLSTTTRDVTAEQKEANEITSLRSEFQRMILAKVRSRAVPVAQLLRRRRAARSDCRWIHRAHLLVCGCSLGYLLACHAR